MRLSSSCGFGALRMGGDPIAAAVVVVAAAAVAFSLLLLLLLQQLVSLWVSLVSLLPLAGGPEGSKCRGLLSVLEGLFVSLLGPSSAEEKQRLLLLQQQQQVQQLLQQLRSLPPPQDPSLSATCIVKGLAALAGGGLLPQGLAAAAAAAVAAPSAAAAASAAAPALPLLPLLLVRCEQQLSLLSSKDTFTLCRALLRLSPSLSPPSSRSNGSCSSSSNNSSSSSKRALEEGAQAALLSSLSSLLLQQQTGELQVSPHSP